MDLLERNTNPDEGAERFKIVASNKNATMPDMIKNITTHDIRFETENTLPGDNGDGYLSKEETVNFVCNYLLGNGPGNLDDVCDAAYVYVMWDGRPKAIKDMDNRQTIFYRPVERIITTNPDNSIAIIAMGLSQLIVATDECTIGSCICPRHGNRKKDSKASPLCWQKVSNGQLDQIPQTSTRKTVNLELMAGLNPDVILETTFWSSRADDLVLKVGTPVIVAGADFTIQSFWDQIRLIGTLLDEERKANDLVKLCENLIMRVNDRITTIPLEKRPRVYFAPRGAGKGFLDPKEGRDFTRTYRIYHPLDLAGGINVADDVTIGEQVNVSLEQIIAWNPAFIFVACSQPEDQGIHFLVEAPELASIEAIQKKQVYNVLYPHCRGRSAPRNIVNVLIFAKLLYPDLFADMDLEKEGNIIYNAFLGVDFTFTEYAEYLRFPLEYFKQSPKY